MVFVIYHAIMKVFLDKIMKILSTNSSAIIAQHYFVDQEVANCMSSRVSHTVFSEPFSVLELYDDFYCRVIILVVCMHCAGSSSGSKATLNTRCSTVDHKIFSVAKR